MNSFLKNSQKKLLSTGSHTYEVCPKSTYFPMYEMVMQHLVDVYRRIGSDLGCMSILVSTGLVESVVRYCCLCMVVFYNLVMFAMQENIEQRYAIKFCVKPNKTATETFASLTEAYGDTTLSRTMVFQWHKVFKDGRENGEDDPRSGRPVSSTNDQNVEEVRAAMAKDCRLSVRMIAEETGLDKNAVHRILTDHLHRRKICAKLVPKNLSMKQKANQLEIFQDLLGRLKIEPNFLD